MWGYEVYSRMKGTDSKPQITARTDKEGNFIRHESEIIKNYLVHQTIQTKMKTASSYYGMKSERNASIYSFTNYKVPADD